MLAVLMGDDEGHGRTAEDIIREYGPKGLSLTSTSMLDLDVSTGGVPSSHVNAKRTFTLYILSSPRSLICWEASITQSLVVVVTSTLLDECLQPIRSVSEF
jgi:hypothetical protein